MSQKHKYLISTATHVAGVKESILKDITVEFDKPMTQENIEEIRAKIINSFQVMSIVTITNIFKFEMPAE